MSIDISTLSPKFQAYFDSEEAKEALPGIVLLRWSGEGLWDNDVTRYFFDAQVEDCQDTEWVIEVDSHTDQVRRVMTYDFFDKWWEARRVDEEDYQEYLASFMGPAD